MGNKKTGFRHLLSYAAIAVLISCTCSLRAQVIATDFNNCTHGVKDYAGNWIIQPLYDNLESDGCGYIVSKGGQYGLIDKAGHALIPAEYDYLYPLYAYDWNHQLPDQYYVVQKNGLFGMIDTNSRMIIPIRYEVINGYPDTTIAVREGKDTWYFYNAAGTRFAIPWKSEYRPSMEIHHRYSISTRTFFRRRSGLIGDSGQVIFPMKYSFFDGHVEHNIITVCDGKKYGYCSAAGKFIWPVSFTFKNNNYGNVEWMQYLGNLYAGPARLGNKMGMINVDGDTLLPFIYDEITSFETYPTRARGANLWLVKKDSLTGVFDDRYGWKIPVSCTTIETFQTYFSDGDSSKVGVLIYEMNGHWGVKTTAGQEILPCVYEERFRKYGNEYVFLHGDTVMYLSAISPVITDRLVSWSRGLNSYNNVTGYRHAVSAPADKVFSSFEGKEGVITYYNPGSTHDWLSKERDSAKCDQGNYYYFTVPDSIIVAGCFYTQVLSQPVLQSSTVRAYHFDDLELRSRNLDYPEVTVIRGNKSNKLSSVLGTDKSETSVYYRTWNHDVFRNDGKVIVSGDSVTNVSSERNSVNGTLYFTCSNFHGQSNAFDTLGNFVSAYRSGMVGDFSDKYMWRYVTGKHGYCCLLFERDSEKLLMLPDETSNKSAPIWDSITLVSNDKGSKLFNISRQRYLSSYGFNSIVPLNVAGTLFAVKTCQGHIGIITAGGTWISDTVFTAFTPSGYITSINGRWQDNQGESSDFYSDYIFSSATESSILFTETAALQTTDQSRELMWSNCLCLHPGTQENWNIGYGSRVADHEYVHYNISTGDSLLYQPWHKRCITDTLYASQRYSTLPEYLTEDENKPDWESEYEYENSEYHTCLYCRKKGFSFQPFGWTRDACYGEFAASFVSDSILSFSSVSGGGHFDLRPRRSDFSNVFLFTDGPHCMTIDSLFDPANDWKNFLINTVLDYVNTHKYVQGNCTNPAGIPSLLLQNWQIVPDGIVLYPPGLSESNQQLWIPLSWSEVGPFLRKDVKTKLPMNGLSN